MIRASELIQALIARAPARPPVERRTGLPYGWALWLRALPPLPAGVRARPGELGAALAARPRSPRVRGEELGRWRAFLSLFRQGWLPAPRDEWPLRWSAGAGSLLLHLLFVAFLAWIAVMQLLRLPPAAEAGGGERIQVGFVGAGDPGSPPAEPAQAADGSGSPDGSPAEPVPPVPVARVAETRADAAEDSAAPAAIAAVPVPVPVAPVPPPPELVERPVPEPAPPQPAEQPVQVTEVEQPTIEYVLPPTTPRRIEAPAPAEPQLREREVRVVQAPVVVAPQVRALELPAPRPRELQLRAREVDEPLPEVAVRPADVRTPAIEVRLPQAPEPGMRLREVPAPRMAEAAAGGATPGRQAPASAPPAPAAATAAAAASGPTPGEAGRSAAAAAPAIAAGDSTWAPLAGDDWGQADAGPQRPGGAPGLFDRHGRVRLPGAGDAGSGATAGPGDQGAPPGGGTDDRGAPGGDSDSWSRERIAESGTWLKRPPYDYEPTSFERYWVPNESLLAEWVRKGIKSVAIPIPGTRKRINCVVSLLQLGGGCGLVDPDLNEQPAEGRPPPDIPFKPELQEDNGSVRP